MTFFSFLPLRHSLLGVGVLSLIFILRGALNGHEVLDFVPYNFPWLPMTGSLPTCNEDSISYGHATRTFVTLFSNNRPE